MIFMAERTFIDTGLLNYLCKDTKGNIWNSFLDVTASNGLKLQGRGSLFLPDDMQFLEFIGLGAILERVPSTLRSDIERHINSLFTQKKPIKEIEINKTLNSIFEKCLTACESLSEITPQGLLDQHKKHHSYLHGKSAYFLDHAISNRFLDGLSTNPQNVYKQICRNLSWQLATTILRSTFNAISINKHPDLVLRLFEPLMAIILHSAFKHGSPPNFFRLAETAYLSYMRQHEKKLNSSDLKWVQEYRREYQTGNKKDLTDCIYLDRALLGYLELTDGEIRQLPVTVLTMDRPIVVLNRLKLLRNMLEKLKDEVEGWSLNPIDSCKVLCLEQINGNLVYKDTIHHAFVLDYDPEN